MVEKRKGKIGYYKEVLKRKEWRKRMSVSREEIL